MVWVLSEPCYILALKELQLLEKVRQGNRPYSIISVVSFLILSLDGQSVGTTLSAVLACFNNIGPGIEAVGPTCNFAFFSDLSKATLIFDMLCGRLEIFPMLILFSRLTWKR